MKRKGLSRHPAAKPVPPTPEQISALAYELWRERGCPEGSDIDDWLEAERRLNGMPPRSRRERDPIPADPDHPEPDTDPALNPAADREIRGVGDGSEQSHPTALNLP